MNSVPVRGNHTGATLPGYGRYWAAVLSDWPAATQIEEVGRRLLNQRAHTTSVRMAPKSPTTALTGSPLLYQPPSAPSAAAANAPTSPRVAVRRKPNGPFRPGATSRAITPVDTPSSAIQRADIEVLTAARTTPRQRQQELKRSSCIYEGGALGDAEGVRRSLARAGHAHGARYTREAAGTGSGRPLDQSRAACERPQDAPDLATRVLELHATTDMTQQEIAFPVGREPGAGQ
jgi:hypothetical protein